MMWSFDCEKKFEVIITGFDRLQYTNVAARDTDRQTDRQTDGRTDTYTTGWHKSRLCITSRGKKTKIET